MRKIFTEELPYHTKGRYKGKIDWKECNNIHFIYDEIEDYLKVVSINKQTLNVYYNGGQYHILTCHLLDCRLGGILGHGNGNNPLSGQTAEESKAIDDYKDILANGHGIEVIRIDCYYEKLETRFNIIKNNAIDKLKNIFELYYIDWDKCNKNALASYIILVCEYKRNNPDKTTTEIGEIFKMNYTTIRQYFKIGNELGLCKYDSSNHFENRTGKTVEIFKDNISLGIFKSVGDLCRKSLELFGVKFISGLISAVCNGKRNHHYGYIFKYVQ